MIEQPSVLVPSHEYVFAGRQFLRVIVTSLAGFVGLLLGLQGLKQLGWLPFPLPPLTGDQFVMRSRFETAFSGAPAEVIIVGDSSAVMGVDALALGSQLPGNPQVYNLGMFLGLPLDVYAEVARRFITNHPGNVRLVLLLTTVSRLTDAGVVVPSVNYWRSLQEESDSAQIPAASLFNRWLLIEDLRNRVLTRLVPFGLHGRAGVFYGGIVEAKNFVDRHRGSAFARGVYNRQGSHEQVHWTLDGRTIIQAARFRNILSRDVPLAFGITPMPETYADVNATNHRWEMMTNLNAVLDARFLLRAAPTTLPDGLFADRVHLNQMGQQRYTKDLATELALLPVWRNPHE